MTDSNDSIDNPAPTVQATKGMFCGPVMPLLIHLSLPVYVGMLFWVLYTVTDIYWISRIDPKDPSYVGGVSLIIPFYMLAFAIANGLLIGVKSLVARAIGESNWPVLQRVAASGFALALVCSILFLGFGYAFAPELTALLGAEGDYYQHALQFLRYVLPAVALLFFFNVMNGIVQGEGKMHYVMQSMGWGISVNLVLDPLFILWLEWGVAGAAFATCIAQAVSIAVISRAFRGGELHVSFNLNGANRNTIEKILQVGIPQGLIEIFVSFSLLIVNWIVISVDPRAMTAFGLCARVDQIILLSVAALSSAVLTAAGQNASRGNYARVRDIQSSAFKLGTVIVFAQVVVLVILAPFIYRGLSAVPEVIDYAVLQTWIVDIFYVLATITLVCQSFFLAIGHPWPAIYVQLIKFGLVALPVMLVSVFIFDLGMYGVWFGLIAGELVSPVLAYTWNKRYLRQLEAGSIQVASTV